MRLLLALLGLIGCAGVVAGILTILRGAGDPLPVPFRFENYGGPGPILAGVILAVGAAYLLAYPPRRG